MRPRRKVQRLRLPAPPSRRVLEPLQAAGRSRSPCRGRAAAARRAGGVRAGPSDRRAADRRWPAACLPSTGSRRRPRSRGWPGRAARPRRCASAAHEALGVLGPVALRLRLVGEQCSVVPDRLAVGAPEARQRPARQRLARIPLALAVVQHAARREALLQALQQRRRRAGAWSGPSAAVFHSAPSMSSIDTKVGSPPMVRRTSCARRSASIASPSASIACHCSSVYGLVTRGSSWMRCTSLAKENSTSPPRRGR